MSNELKSNQRGFVGFSSSRANGEIGGYKESKNHITVEFYHLCEARNKGRS